jgi:hypothetical protein
MYLCSEDCLPDGAKKISKLLSKMYMFLMGKLTGSSELKLTTEVGKTRGIAL